MDPRIQYVLAVAPTVALLAIMLAGIILGILQRRNQPLASLLVIPGLFALSAIIGTVAVRSYARHQSFDRYEDASVVAQHLATVHVGLFALNFIGITLITAAVFANRGVIRIGRLT